MTTRKILCLLAGVGALASMGTAQAVPVATNCPGTAVTTDREFTLTIEGPPGATCFSFGTGNLPNTVAGYSLLDKSDDASSGLLNGSLTGAPSLISGLSGTFSINAPGFSSFLIGFKSGTGQLDPDWAIFALPAGITSGSWAISGQQALSHANLWGKRTQVPEPATIALMGLGLIGAGVARRRKAS